MPQEHVVQQGDCLSSIAHAYGFKDYRTIYNHSLNASFKAKRPNPNLIYPGDVILIPDLGTDPENCATDKVHKFQISRSGTHLAIVLEHDGKPLANIPYELTIGNQIANGTTDSAGLLRHPIEPTDSRGLLKITNPAYEWDLLIGELDPVAETSGVQARLNNLGYFCGPVDGLFGPRTRGALRQFQARHNVTPSGNVDGATKSALTRAHDGE